MNGLALDRDTQVLYYAAPGSVDNLEERGIYYTSLQYNKSAKIAPLTGMGIVDFTARSIPQNACWYKNSYWFIVTETLVLRRVFFAYSGLFPTGIASYVDYPISAPVAQIPLMRFGGIDIDVNTDILYGATTRGQFFNIDLKNLAAPLPFTQVVAPDTDDRPSLQIAFNVDYSILYGHYQVDGTWYTVDRNTGALTKLSFTVSSDLNCVDLSGALPSIGTYVHTCAAKRSSLKGSHATSERDETLELLSIDRIESMPFIQHQLKEFTQTKSHSVIHVYICYRHTISHFSTNHATTNTGPHFYAIAFVHLRRGRLDMHS